MPKYRVNQRIEEYIERFIVVEANDTEEADKIARSAKDSDWKTSGNYSSNDFRSDLVYEYREEDENPINVE